MSPATHQPIYLVTLMTIVLTQIVTGLHVETFPEIVNELITKETNIKCLADGSLSSPEQIVSMRLSKKGEESFISLNTTSLDYGKGITDNMKAEGNISKVNTTESYLSLTIKDPNEVDAGAYVCQLFFMSNNTLEEGRVEANLTVDNNNDKLVIRHILKEISKAENVAIRQVSYSMKQELDIRTLKKQAKKQKLNIRKLKKQTTKQEVHIVQLKKETKQEEQQTEQEEDDTQEIEEQTTQQKQSTDEETAEIKKLRKKIRKIAHKVPKKRFTAAFSASYSMKDPMRYEDFLIFRDVLLDIGQNYNSTSGIFTAPRRGVYLFTLMAMTRGFINLSLRVNNNKGLTGLHMFDNAAWGQSAVTVLVSLKAGDEVRPFVDSYLITRFLHEIKYSKFSGYLVSLT